MPADITPEQARLETIENLIDMANRYRVGTGAHTVVINEINRRDELPKNRRKILVAFFIAIISGIIGLLFWWLRA